MATDPQATVIATTIDTAPTPPPPAKPHLCGGPTEARQIEESDNAIFEQYREIIEQKLQEQFNVPKDFKLQPAKVRTQVVAGTNYLFHVRLPNDEFAHVKIFKPLKCNELTAGSDRSSFVTVEKETTKD